MLFRCQVLLFQGAGKGLAQGGALADKESRWTSGMLPQTPANLFFGRRFYMVVIAQSTKQLACVLKSCSNPVN